MAAALMASRIAGEVRLRARRGEPLPELIRELNTMLHRAYGKMGLFATLLGGYIDHEQRQLELISAGHVPLIQRHRGAMRQYTSRNMPPSPPPTIKIRRTSPCAKSGTWANISWYTNSSASVV